MIKVVCGLSGSGKTTYVKNNKKKNDIILDSDSIKLALDFTKKSSLIKKLQIDMLNYIKNNCNNDIWYITCYPNSDELKMFDDKTDFIWINQLDNQCLKNIEIRNRKGDDINQLTVFNEKIKEKYESSNIKFKIIDFTIKERW